MEKPKNFDPNAPEKSKPEIYLPEVRAIIERDRFLLDGQKALASMSDKRDTLHHSERITNLGYLLAKHHNFSKEETRLFVEICLLHDIGKTEVSRKHLTKPFGKFGPKDFEAVKKHPRYGYSYLKHEGRSPRVYNSVLLHHQFQPDPYPKIGAEFKEIKDEDVDNARLLAMLDVFDTRVFGRSYAKIQPQPRDIAEEELKKQFDQPADKEVIDFLFLQSEKIRSLYI